MSNFFQKLSAETAEARQALYQLPLIQNALQGKISKQTYIDYLTESYHHVKHTTPLLMLTGSRIGSDKEFIRDAMAEYIKEEVGHQEWILDDIRNAGGDKEKVRNGQPKFDTELMVSYAYDTVMRKNPLGFLGMVFVLEGTSINLAANVADSLQRSLGLGKNCFSYLISHGVADLKHIKFFENLVNKIEDRNDQEAIIHMAQMMFRLFANVLNNCSKSE